MNIYAGNLSHQTTEDDLRRAFEAFGQVESVNIVKDKSSGESNGFGFVLMPSKEEAQKAIDGMNGKELMDQVIRVAEARPKITRPRRTGGGSYGGGRDGRQGGGGYGDRDGNRQRY
ncbi:MAG: RNA-binding protein [Planctomycetota bacterium]